jgi:phosphatidylserine/phosphatidylglycerophosphate/cardiolipin synthase-like enzyme
VRQRQQANGLTVHGIAGTHVVLLGLDIAADKRAGLLGFAIQREDHVEDERYWLKGMKAFAETDPGLGPGGQASSREQPFQTFQWADYSAKPDRPYTYTVVPLYGTPSQLEEGGRVAVQVRTEAESGAAHSVFFNRGAAASQEYARRFENKRPDEVGAPAFKWLSRGLVEAMRAFIGRASGAGFGLYGALYEFQHPDVLSAIKAAGASGAKVKVIYDAVPNADKSPLTKNAAAIAGAHIKSRCKGRTKARLMHNKFLVLTRRVNGDDQPLAVWTGSTNATVNGLFGHSNCGHVVEDASIAAPFLAYWRELLTDPVAKDLKDWTEDQNPAPPAPGATHPDTVAFFSPRRGLRLLDWYAALAGQAQEALFMTFAFGMHKSLLAVYDRTDPVLRFALMEKEGTGSGLAQARIDIRRVRRRPNVLIAIGGRIVTNRFDRWLREIDRVVAEAHVLWIHTKYMLVDPLGDAPVVVTGSANFSEASTDTNDENMLVIRNDRRVADIYLGEYMRLFSHYAFREAVRIHFEQTGEVEDWKPNFLVPDPSWQAEYFQDGHDRAMRRRYFART